MAKTAKKAKRAAKKSKAAPAKKMKAAAAKKAKASPLKMAKTAKTAKRAKKTVKAARRGPWNKGLEVGQRDAFSRAEVGRIRRALARRGAAGLRDSALFATAIDTMLRAPDLLALTVKDVRKRGGAMRDTLELPGARRGRGLRCTLSEAAQEALARWIDHAGKRPGDHLFTGRGRSSARSITARQLSRLVKEWAAAIGLDGSAYGIESLRRTRAVHILRQTGDLEAIRALLGLTDVRSTARYLSDTGASDPLEVSRAHEL